MGTAHVPSLIFHIDATGRENVVFSFDARDIDGSGDNAVQQIAVQYRIGGSSAWIDLPAGFIDDAMIRQNQATRSTAVGVTVPGAVNGRGEVQVRVIKGQRRRPPQVGRD